MIDTNDCRCFVVGAAIDCSRRSAAAAAISLSSIAAAAASADRSTTAVAAIAAIDPEFGTT